MPRRLSEHIVSLHTTAEQLKLALHSVEHLLELKQFSVEEQPTSARLSEHLGERPFRILDAQIQFRVVQSGEVPKLDTPAKTAAYMGDIHERFPAVETFWVIFLDRRLRAMARHMVTLGTLTSSLVHPREVFRSALMASACSVAVAHNHPSCDPTPSAADLSVTRQLRQAAQTLDIDLVDHVILGRREVDPRGIGYYSFRESGVL